MLAANVILIKVLHQENTSRQFVTILNFSGTLHVKNV